MSKFEKVARSMTSCFSFLLSILKEFKRGDQILNSNIENKEIDLETWSLFFQPSRFFFRHSNYLLIKLGAPDPQMTYLWYTFFIAVVYMSGLLFQQ